MSLLTAIILISSLALLEIQGKDLDPGPQVLNETTKTPPQSNQKRYVMKEIILYLTPSQIKALQEGRGFIGSQQIPNADNIEHTNAHGDGKELAHHNSAEQINQQLAPAQPLQATPIEEPHSNDFIPVIPPPEYRQPKIAYLNIDPQSLPLILKPLPVIPYDHPQNPALIPQEPLHGNIQESELPKDHLKVQWYRWLDQNRAHFKALEALNKFDADKLNQYGSDLLQYATKYNDNRYGPGVEHRLKNQHALLQNAPIANSPPVVLHKDINVKHSPIHLTKQIKVPVPTPVLIPVPEHFAVNIPHPYPIPLEILKPVPVPFVKAHNLDVERPGPIEIGKLVPYSETKNLYPVRPHFFDRVVPLEDPALKIGSFPIHTHVWNH